MIAARTARRIMETSREGRAIPQSIVADTGSSAAGAFAEAGADERGSLGAPASQRTRDSLLRYSPAVVLLAILIADSNRRADPDLWGHIRFGQAFIANRHLIDRDPYSYSAPGAPWHDYEWLAEVVIAFAYNAAGVVGQIALGIFPGRWVDVFLEQVAYPTQSQASQPFSPEGFALFHSPSRWS